MTTLLRVLVFGLLALLVGQAVRQVSQAAIERVDARLEARR